MFATKSRKRQHSQRQEESPPLPGTDSTYGVRSVSEWGGDSVQHQHTKVKGEGEGIDALQLELREAAGGADKVHDEGGRIASSIVEAQEGVREQVDEVEMEALDTPAPPLVQLMPSPNILPPSPPAPAQAGEEEVAGGEEGVEALRPRSPSGPSGMHAALLLLDPAHQRHLAHDAPSEPSSPASFTSLPSYVASVSSVSRTSSPIGMYEHATCEAGQDRRRGVHSPGPEGDLGDSSELVLPTLSLPSTSLHSSQGNGRGLLGGSAGSTLGLGVPRWEGDGERGLRIVLLGAEGEVRSVVQGLQATEEVVRTGGGEEIGIVRGGRVVLTLATGLSGARVRSRVTELYSGLNTLLHPAAPSSAQARLAELVEKYTAKSEWVHLVYALTADAHFIEAVAPSVPTCAPRYEGELPLFALPLEESRAPTPSPEHRPDEPTPMGRAESSGYFAPVGEESASRQPATQHDGDDAVRDLLRILDHSELVISASTSAFLAWRPPPLDASSSSMDSSTPASSASALETSGSGAMPMPTVARAQGGGEWEATLSRRIAKRKEVTVSEERERPVRGRGRGRGRRRSSREEVEKGKNCAPLFPVGQPGRGRERSSSRSTGVGLRDLVDKTFAPMKRMMHGRWKGVVVVAVAVAVGWGYWASRRV